MLDGTAARVGVDVDAVGLMRLPQLHRDAGNTGLVVLLRRVGGVELVTGHVIADGADDPAVLVLLRSAEVAARPVVIAGAVCLDTPVEVCRQPDHR